MAEFLLDYKHFFVILHTAAMAVGVGTATVTDVFFFKFLKKLHITQREAGLLRTLSAIIWIALIVAVLTGTALYLAEMDRLNQSPKFLAKVSVVAVIILNGLLLNAYISPRLAHISFGKISGPALRRFRKIAFASGAVSMVSWYAALVLGAWRKLPATFEFIISIYIAVLALALIASQITEYRYARRANE